MSLLLDLKPRTKRLVFDLAEEAGFDVTDWRESSKRPKNFKANPKYCYEWSYLQPGKLVILNLWHPSMVEHAGTITHTGNYRSDSEFYRTVSHKPEWARRAQALDDTINTALEGNLPVRVILLDGDMRRREELRPSIVHFRALDIEPWTISQYDRHTGAFELTRGIVTGQYVDQFDLDQLVKSKHERKELIGFAYYRDPAVRRRALQRADGHCELCGQPGFPIEGGALYLETHHIVPLGEGGADEDKNVAVLCATDHRRAHFAMEKAGIRAELLLRRSKESAGSVGMGAAR